MVGKHFKEIPMVTDWTMNLEFGRESMAVERSVRVF